MRSGKATYFSLYIWMLNCKGMIERSKLSLRISLLLVLRRHQRYIGKVKHAVFHTQKTGRKRVIVSTEENVVASLDLRHGEICKINDFDTIHVQSWSLLFLLFLFGLGWLQFGGLSLGQRMLSMGLTLPWENVKNHVLMYPH